MVLVDMIPLGEAPAATLVVVEETSIPMVETLAAVETRLIPTLRRRAILSHPFPIC